MLNVLFTVDVELWPQKWDLSHKSMKVAFDKDILGKTARGEYGLPFQLKTFSDYEIKATFLVEPFFSVQMGQGSLQDITGLISDRDQKVELHLHTEWVDKVSPNIMSGGERLNINEFSLGEQTELLSIGLERLNLCYVENITAFRAGNYGANFDTLKALKKVGIKYDTSYNAAYLGHTCDLHFGSTLMQAVDYDGITEVPISQYKDGFGRRRHVQLNSISFEEIKILLEQASAQNWETFVIVSHSNELLTSDKNKGDNIVIRRLEKLCRYLSDNTKKFRTCFFDQMDKDKVTGVRAEALLKADVYSTSKRILEQGYRRAFL